MIGKKTMRHKMPIPLLNVIPTENRFSVGAALLRSEMAMVKINRLTPIGAAIMLPFVVSELAI